MLNKTEELVCVRRRRPHLIEPDMLREPSSRSVYDEIKTPPISNTLFLPVRTMLMNKDNRMGNERHDSKTAAGITSAKQQSEQPPISIT